LPVPEEIAGPIPAKELDADMSGYSGYEMPVTAQPVTYKNPRRVSKTARFTELEPIASNISDSAPRDVAPVPVKPEARTTITTYALPTMFDEASLPAPQQPFMPPTTTATASPQKRKLSKNPTAKLAKNEVVKKNRWSLRSSKSTPVAV
jgi:hypothetical protein